MIPMSKELSQNLQNNDEKIVIKRIEKRRMLRKYLLIEEF
jgi:hypothetical protein